MTIYEDEKIPTFRKPKATATIKHRKYRADKRHPKKLTVTLTEDFGTIEQTQKFTFDPQETLRTNIHTHNPNLVLLLKLTDYANSQLRIFYYQDNPKMGFISLNGQLIRLNKHNWREIQGAFMKLGKNLGLLK